MRFGPQTRIEIRKYQRFDLVLLCLNLLLKPYGWFQLMPIYSLEYQIIWIANQHGIQSFLLFFFLFFACLRSNTSSKMVIQREKQTNSFRILNQNTNVLVNKKKRHNSKCKCPLLPAYGKLDLQLTVNAMRLLSFESSKLNHKFHQILPNIIGFDHSSYDTCIFFGSTRFFTCVYHLLAKCIQFVVVCLWQNGRRTGQVGEKLHSDALLVNLSHRMDQNIGGPTHMWDLRMT